MRTTVTLEPDVETLVRRAMKERGTGFKETVNDGLRRGLGGASAPVDLSFPSFDMGVPFRDVIRANRLAAELEDEALLGKLAEGR